jgi:hypothetical protein
MPIEHLPTTGEANGLSSAFPRVARSAWVAQSVTALPVSRDQLTEEMGTAEHLAPL